MDKLKNSGVEIGQIYDRLEVVNALPRNRNGRTVWACKCQCGVTVPVTGPALRRGHTRSCGCLRRDINRAQMMGNKYNRADAETVFWNAYIRSYENGAKSRNLAFELSRDEAKALAIQPCFYCESAPGPSLAAASHYKSSTKVQGVQFHQHLYDERVFNANGIDRVHNHLGYTLANCVPCCRLCNRIKSAMSLEVFARRMHTMAEKVLQLIQNVGTCAAK